jgi:two-component system, NtrC family, response regulator HupR/HoxA
VEYFIEKNQKETGLAKKKVSKKLLAKLMEHNWPGNIRELENEIERLIVLTGDADTIEPELLSERISSSTGTPVSSEAKKTLLSKYTGKLKDAIELLERDLISEGLKASNWNKSKLAKMLGISRASLISKVDKYDLDKRKAPR